MPGWPDGKLFAFSVVDDTDFATVELVRPVYDLLSELGIHTTKTVWPLAAVQQGRTGGSALDDAEYRAWIVDLRDRGFEIASHGTTDHSSPRTRILQGMDVLADVLGEVPRLHANHTGQVESIYWGASRLDGAARTVYTTANRLKGVDPSYAGHEERSPYFWGDLCREHITYVRNFTFRDINTLKCDPRMPWFDPRRPWVRHWFSCSDGAHCPQFCDLLQERHQQRLMEEGGACIMYTHFAVGYVHDGRLDPTFEARMRHLASLPGWFAPASEVLDHLRARATWTETASKEYLDRLQWRWLRAKLLSGRS